MRSFLLGEELEAALACGSPARRTDILNRVADLFIFGAGRYSPDQVQLFDDVMTRLLRGVDAMARAGLAERLAPVANAPSTVIRMLASDDNGAVAGPVLAQSELLTDQDLLQVAGSKSQSHLLAIARRRNLNTPVTDLLIARGDRQVFAVLAGNTGAQFSAPGRQRLAQAQRSGADAPNRPSPRESEIYRYARDGKLTETAAALSIMSGIPNDGVERALLNPRADALLVLARAAGLSSITTEAILRLRAADCGMSEEDLAQALAKFSRLPRDSARRVLNFFRIRLEKPVRAPALPEP
jgi:uncharacterized protein (DUF2336 family)